ncbi:MAG: hypothetical protein PHN39_02565 [Candidatus Pacebacteria bacterium]|nr:hypothetical protein [Candidatus Paceibacterota bacterium]
MSKIIVAILLTAIVAGGGAFYGGMQYGRSQQFTGGNFANFRNLTPDQRQQLAQQGGGTRRAGQGGATGEIISKDDKSITIKLSDGGSKIVFFSTSTPIMQFSTGTVDALTIGESIVANGAANQDGSITAQSIQIRPSGVGLPQ